MGSIVDGISSLFGGGSADRNQHNDLNSAGQALTAQNDATAPAWNYFADEGATPIAGMNNALNNQGSAVNSQNAQATTEGNAFNFHFPTAINALFGNSGFNPDGSYNAKFDPYATTAGSTIGAYSDKVAPGYDNAVTAAQHDLLQRGMTGANTLAPSEIGDIRRTQASDVAGFGRNLGVQSEQERYNRLQNALQSIMGVGGAAAQGFGNAASGYGTNAAGYGGLGDQYGNVGRNYLNLAGTYGNLASGYNGQAQGWSGLGAQQSNNLFGLASLFG